MSYSSLIRLPIALNALNCTFELSKYLVSGPWRLNTIYKYIEFVFVIFHRHKTQ